MGNQPNPPSPQVGLRTFVQDDHYGGNVMLSAITETVYQQFIL
jgi:hypothetical protein